jgi:membrane associated rhomboid family serine protease
VVLYSVAGQLNGYASPMGAVSGLLAAVMCQIGNQKFKIYMVKVLSLRTTVLIVMTVLIIVCLWTSIIMLVVPVSGFVTGLLYCRLQKKIQRFEARFSRNRQGRIGRIEID